jgi:hypothetical protein
MAKKPRKPYTPRIAPAAPDRGRGGERLQGLVSGELSREDASDWATQWVAADDPAVDDDMVWEALTKLCGADLPSTDREYLYGRVDFEVWLAELRSGL